MIAAVISMAVLFGWSYFFTPPRPVDNANTNVAANANTAPAATVQPAATVAPTPEAAVTTPDTTPNRTVTIRSSLYEVKLDSKGAVATSWVILKNKSPRAEFPIFADGSHDGEQKPLQLISDEALKRSPREIPFRLATDDQALATLVNERNYSISIADDNVTLAAGEEKQIDFTLTDGSGVEVKKSFLFRADSYIADLGVTVKRGGQPVPNTKLLIGASIGDHAINNHNFYHIESEAVAAVNDDFVRHQGNYSFEFGADNRAKVLTDTGRIEWAGVGDAYFAMAAIPATVAPSVEYHASRYDVQTKPYFESIFQWILRNSKTTETRHLVTVYLPIPTDGSVTKVFTGTKDFFLLSSLNDGLSRDVGRPVEITNLINFSNYWWLRWLTRPLSIPILYALNFFNGILHNYGLAIIVFTFLVLLAFVPAALVAIEVVQEGFGQRAEDEGDTGQDQRPAKEGCAKRRSTHAAAANGAVEDDKGRSADRRMSADAATVSAVDRVLYGCHRLARGTTGLIYLAPRSLGRRPMAFAGIRICALDDLVDEVYATSCHRHAGAGDAAEDDDVSDAGDDVMGYVGRTVGTFVILVLRQHRQLRPADGHQPDE